MGTTLPAVAPLPTSRQARSRLALLATTLTMALGVVVLSLAWLWPQIPSRIIEVPLADLEVGVPREVRPPRLGLDGRGAPTSLWVVRLEDDVHAYWSMTTHLADCSIRPLDLRKWPELAGTYSDAAVAHGGVPVVFRTPCIGSTYGLDGTRLFGPAFRDLDQFPVSVDGASVRIDLRSRFLGRCSFRDIDPRFFTCSPVDGPPQIEPHRTSPP